MTPGDPVEVIAGGIASEETKNEIRAELGLDKNLTERYLEYIVLIMILYQKELIQDFLEK